MPQNTFETIREARLDRISSFRINNMVLHKLKVQAGREGLSLNTLINRIFADYLDWDMTAVKAGWIVVLKDVLKDLMNELDEKTLHKIAIRTADATDDVRLMMTGDNSIDGFFSILRERLKKSGINYMESHENEMTKFMILHNMGRKWSYFYKTQHERMLKNLGQPAELEYTDNSLIINVRHR
jgi:hypothetical protein